MRVSIWLGLPILAIGILFAYFAKEIKFVAHDIAGIVAVVLFILLSSMALGVGAALVIHWMMNLVAGWFAFVAELFLLIFVRGHALKPAQWRVHREQQMQFSMLGHFGLDKQSGLLGINPGSQPVNHHVPHVFLDHFGGFVVRGQRMPIGDKKQAGKLVLEFHPVLQHTMVMTKVQQTGGAHARQYAFRKHGDLKVKQESECAQPGSDDGLDE